MYSKDKALSVIARVQKISQLETFVNMISAQNFGDMLGQANELWTDPSQELT
jgi:hypothetical protein